MGPALRPPGETVFTADGHLLRAETLRSFALRCKARAFLALYFLSFRFDF